MKLSGFGKERKHLHSTSPLLPLFLNTLLSPYLVNLASMKRSVGDSVGETLLA